MSDILVEEQPGGVRVVRLNRPGRLNALTPDMVAQITAAMRVERQHRAIVITGNGRASPEQALELENRTQILANGTADAAEARSAFLEKRPPGYTGR